MPHDRKPVSKRKRKVQVKFDEKARKLAEYCDFLNGWSEKVSRSIHTIADVGPPLHFLWLLGLGLELEWLFVEISRKFRSPLPPEHAEWMRLS